VKPQEIRQMSSDQIAERLEEIQRGLFNLRFRLATRQLSNSSELRKIKKDVARLKTAIREREIAREMEQQEGGAS